LSQSSTGCDPNSPAFRAALAQLERLLQDRRNTNRLKRYTPYARQREFHDAGAVHHERLFMAGNQLGKTLSGAAEMAMHLTGRYPEWWKGKVFNEPIKIWASSVTGEATRDNPQTALVGPPQLEEQWGTGWIPKECLVSWDRAHGVPNLLDNMVVRWGGGGDTQARESLLSFKYYAQGREKWQGPTLHGVWFDEEPPADIYSEGLTRTQAKGLFSVITFTPLLGMSDVVSMFLKGQGQKAAA
jgi:phage terminase large subunit-like protein